MLVLPALRVVDFNVAHSLARTVAILDVNRKRHHAIGREYSGTIALRTLNIVLAQVDHALLAQQASHILNRRHIC